MTEKEKFFQNLAEKRKNGLVGINFTPNCQMTNESIVEESLYAELNRMDEAAQVTDDELFPNREEII